MTVLSDLPDSGVSGESPVHFNWGAFLMPWFWGVAHGHWPGVLFLPAWAFVDNMARGPRPFGTLTAVLAAAMGVATLGLQVVFALHADRVTWARTSRTASAEEYVRRQRAWAVAGWVVTIAAGVWIASYLRVS